MWAYANCFVSTWIGVLAVLLVLSEDPRIESQTGFNASTDPWRRLPIDAAGSQACGAFRSDGQDAGACCVFDFASLRQRWPCARSSDWSHPRDASRGVWKCLAFGCRMCFEQKYCPCVRSIRSVRLVWKCFTKRNIKQWGETQFSRCLVLAHESEAARAIGQTLVVTVVCNGTGGRFCLVLTALEP